ncbi:hypothetical protein B0T22DRAFT_440881 [Podospora appendiculata]|uniref:Uncharacterized protein n=1 Tax=Podospora appendiculata TaxID=314037 RepID=A0AAE1CDA8_9PEZI|nr:hypothetical protein B0T22DRAFT_440881 [Podospora appendiculata]
MPQAAQFTMRVGAFDIPVHVPLLGGADEASLNEWKSDLHSMLKALRLQQYIQEDAPGPRPTTSRANHEWKNQRASVQRILVRSLSLNHITAAMKRMGWTPHEVDPRGTFLKAFRVFLQDTTDMLLEEYIALRPSAFESFRYYVLHLQFLKDRLAFLDLPMDDNTHIWLALNGIKQRYPDDHANWVRMMKRGTLSWNRLMNAFSILADQEPDYNPIQDELSKDTEENSLSSSNASSSITVTLSLSPEPFEPALSCLFMTKTRSGKVAFTEDSSAASSGRRSDSFDFSSLKQALAEISLPLESSPSPTTNEQAKFDVAGNYETLYDVTSLPVPPKYATASCRLLH